MALISDYTSLKAALESYLNRTDVTAYEDIIIQSAQRWIEKNIRCRQMETTLGTAISSGSMAVPANFIGLKSAYVVGTPTQVLQRRNVEQIYTQYPTRSSSGKPKFIAREGANFIFGPYPDSNYSINGVYYAKFNPISTTTTNALISDHPDIWLFASLCEAEPFLENDERVRLWKSKRDEIAQDINNEETDQNWSGSSLSIQPA